MKFTAEGIVTQQQGRNGDKVAVVTSWIKLVIAVLAIMAVIGSGYATFAQVAKNEQMVHKNAIEIQKLKVEQSADSMYTQRMLEEIIKVVDPDNADKKIERLKKEREEIRKDLERKFLNDKSSESD